MHEQVIFKLSLLVLLIFFGGCSANSIRIKETAIQNETQLSRFSKNELASMINLNRSTSKNDIFQNANMLDTGKYRIIYNNDSEELFIVKDGMVLIGLRGEAKYIYNESPAAPLFGSETSIIDGHYIKYNGPTQSFEDYGMNGVNVISDISGMGSQAYREGKQCPKVISHGLACCPVAGEDLQLFKFSPSSGWSAVAKERSESLCKLSD